MRKLLTILLLCLSLTPPSAARAQDGLNKRVDELGQQIAAKMTAKQKTTVAVVEFTDLQGNTTDFGRFLAEELITRLMETEKFRVIERQLLNKIIAEQKLSLTGVIDPASAKQLGKILGVEAIVSGTVTNLSQSLKVNARLISTETGEIFSVASAEIFKDESVTGLLANGGGASPAPTPKPTPQAAATGKVPPQRVKDFIFEVTTCKLTGDSVTCYLSIKNDSPEDRGLRIWKSTTRMVDEFGNERLATVLSLGTYVTNSYNGEIDNDLISQVPTRASIKFENVSTQATRATLSISASSGATFGGGGGFKVTLRDVPIVK
jgi:TolB-like protein